MVKEKKSRQSRHTTDWDGAEVRAVDEYDLDRSQGSHTQEELCSLQSALNVHIPGLWEETRAPTTNPRRNREKTSHRKTQNRPQNPPATKQLHAVSRSRC